MDPGGRGRERDERRRGSCGDGSSGREPPEEVEEDEVDDEGREEARRNWEGRMKEDTRRRVIEL